MLKTLSFFWLCYIIIIKEKATGNVGKIYYLFHIYVYVHYETKLPLLLEKHEIPKQLCTIFLSLEEAMSCQINGFFVIDDFLIQKCSK